MSSVYKPEKLIEWAKMCVDDKAFPIEVIISINKSGNYTIEQTIDGRKLRGRFIGWMADEFHSQSKIVPPKNRNSKVFAKMWTVPLETLLRQAVYVGGIKYDDLKPRDKYSTLNAMCFRLLLKDVLETQREQGLTIHSPLSIEKVGTDVCANNNHYKMAVRKLESESN